MSATAHEDGMIWKHFPHYRFFVRGIHRIRWIPVPKGSIIWCCGVFFVVSQNNLLNKWSNCRWFETSLYCYMGCCQFRFLSMLCFCHSVFIVVLYRFMFTILCSVSCYIGSCLLFTLSTHSPAQSNDCMHNFPWLVDQKPTKTVYC